MAFKVKTTAPKKYCVKPSSGMVGPQSSLPVQVLMQAQKEPPADMADCKDKFLVQSTPCTEDWDANKATDLFDKGKNSRLLEEKLRVILEGPAAPPSPVPELPDHQEGAPAAAMAGLPMSTRGAGEKGLADENAKLKARLSALEMRAEPSKVGPNPGVSITLIHLLMVAIVAYILGSYLS